MNNPRLASRYAKSLIDIATEFKQLDTVHNDILLLKSIVDKSHDFVLMLNSPIINTDKKYKIISTITAGTVHDAWTKRASLILGRVAGVQSGSMEGWFAPGAIWRESLSAFGSNLLPGSKRKNLAAAASPLYLDVLQTISNSCSIQTSAALAGTGIQDRPGD